MLTQNPTFASTFALTATAACLGLTVAAPAALVTITADPADAETTRTGTGTLQIDRLTNGVLRIGSSGDSTKAAVLPFELPTLAAGETITTANFALSNLGASGNPSASYNADLYGLGFRSSAAVQPTDFYAGTVPDVTDATLIEADFISSGTAGNIETDAAGDGLLVAYLNAQYAQGATGGDFVFLRLNPDVATTPNNFDRYQIAAEENTFESAGTLTIETTAIPEPSTGLAAIAGLGLLAARRRR